ncbi:substrate-binding domain-containing protein [Nonomuraea angiospora]|uniref:substrate-binding domain-containing protein n=1 Tax=Nonomuraea angiospora TaxID=46172 RepID=UPI0034197ECB
MDRAHADGGVRYAAGRLQAEHLIRKGHTRLAYVLSDEPRLAALGQGRAEGAMEACAAAGLTPPVVSTIALDATAAAEATESRRDGAGACEAAPTAVCAYNDEVALAILAGMRMLGLSAPADLAVIGADDIPGARFAAPPLTTVAQNSGELGARSAKALLEALEGGSPDLDLLPGDIHVVERVSA